MAVAPLQARPGAKSMEPYYGGFVVTPHDTNFLETPARALWIGGAGTFTLTAADGADVLISGVPAGTLIPIRAKRVKAAGTTATLIVALY
jgi:hypothetical protein